MYSKSEVGIIDLFLEMCLNQKKLERTSLFQERIKYVLINMILFEKLLGLMEESQFCQS